MVTLSEIQSGQPSTLSLCLLLRLHTLSLPRTLFIHLSFIMLQRESPEVPRLLFFFFLHHSTSRRAALLAMSSLPTPGQNRLTFKSKGSFSFQRECFKHHHTCEWCNFCCALLLPLQFVPSTAASPFGLIDAAFNSLSLNMSKADKNQVSRLYGGEEHCNDASVQLLNKH